MRQPTSAIANRRAACWETLAWLYILNVALLMIVGRSYLSAVPAGTSLPGCLLTGLAFVANFALLALAPVLLMTLTVWFGRVWLTALLGMLGFGLLNVFIYADTIIYELWRFHFNGMVWNLLTTPGAGDTVTAGKGTIVHTAIMIGIILAVEVVLACVAVPFLRRRQIRLLSVKRVGLAALVLIAVDKISYAVADSQNSIEAHRIRTILPVYQTITMNKFLHKVLGIKKTPLALRVYRPGYGSLNYPKAPLTFRADAPRPNVLIIAIEGARFDMLRPDVMPFLTQWGEQHLVFDNNYSSGNTTRYGIFGLLYGIHGSYWQRMLAERDGPVVIKSLQPLGYRFRVITGTDLHYPEFRSTCFVDIPAAITDKWPGDRTGRDKLMTEAFVKFLDDKPTPFFTFMFYDASHQPYRYPPEHAVFDVGHVTDDLNYIQLARAPGEMALIKNRYQNSLHYVDAEIGKAIGALEQHGLLSNTLVFVMGDHGEEFRECGLFGHDSDFTSYQTHTLMVAHMPGEASRHITNLTSHADVPATILAELGVQNPQSDYIQGQPILSDAPRPYVFVASWDTAAIIAQHTTTVFGLEAYKTETTVYDNNCQPLPNQRDALNAQSPKLLQALEEMRQFTK